MAIDHHIQQWRVGVQPSSPTSMGFVDIPLDPPDSPLEGLVGPLKAYRLTLDLDKLPSATDDVARVSTIAEEEELQLDKVDTCSFDLSESLEGSHNFSGVYASGQIARTSKAGIDQPIANPGGQVLRKPLDRRSSTMFTTLSDDRYSTLQNLERTSVDTWSTCLGTAKSFEAQVASPLDCIPGRDLGEGRSQPLCNERNERPKPTNVEPNARPQLRRLTNLCFAGGQIRLLNGRPFDLCSADSASTRSSIFDDPLEAETVAPSEPETRPTEAVMRPPAMTESTPGAYASTADIPIPVFPHAHLTTSCKEHDCPIWTQHEKGPYLHQGKLRVREGTIFGASNPPPRIWQAYDRIKSGMSVPEKDVALVNSFVKYHFGFSDKGDLEEVESAVKNSSRSVAPLARVGGLVGALQRVWGARRK
ncbi:MAG: hypothetical protein Q9163_002974 [Psora crenata]